MNETVNATDNAVMGQVGAGDVSKMAVLFERHHRPLFRYFVSLNRNRELSEDLVQDVFFRMLRYRASYDPKQSFTAWMYQIARNANVDQATKRRAEVVGIDEFDDRRPEPASDAPGPEEITARGQNVALLKKALERLPHDKREILILSRYNEMKYEEIAGILGCEVGTVKVRVFRAMRALEQIYGTLAKEKSA
jgi:RNA polymerase sigma factor (sigma-70 family)